MQKKKTLQQSPGTGRKLIVHKTFRRRLGRLLNILCTFNLSPVSTGIKTNYNNCYIAPIFSTSSKKGESFEMNLLRDGETCLKINRMTLFSTNRL